MKVSELTKILSKNRCHIIRHGSNHDIWYSEITGKQFPVPRHPSQDVPKGTYENIKKAAGF
ncbi:MAG: type II toxin-antitoxin system HicA family toxin [Lachnospiraceae bacterium]|nr:type II toxin-antitoxin system HicA family toxin [Lachnospiraceae bacterium]